MKFIILFIIILLLVTANPLVARVSKLQNQIKTAYHSNVPTNLKRIVIPAHIVMSRGGNTSSPKTPRYSTEEIDLLAKLVYAEARGEGIEGMLAVADVVLNRVKDERFPDSIKDIIFQKGQFESVHNGSINMKPNEDAYEAVRKALNGENIVEDAVFFWQPNFVRNAKKVIGYKEVVVKIGRHQFAK